MFENLEFTSRFDVGAFLRPLGKVYYTYILLHNNIPFYVGTSCNWKRVYGHFSENSNRVNFLLKRKIKNVQESGENVTIRLHKQYATPEEMYEAEIALITMYGKKIDNKGGLLTNLSDGGEGRAGIGTSDKQKSAVSAANTGKPKTPETLEKLSKAMKKTFSIRGGTFKGKKHSDETKALMSKNNSGEGHPQFGLRGDKHFNYGKPRSAEVVQKIKDSISKIDMSCSEDRKEGLKNYWKNQPVMKCPHCGKESSFKAAMVRCHFDRCKSKSDTVIDPLQSQNILQNVIQT